MMSGKSEDVHPVTHLTSDGELCLTLHTAETCPVHGSNGKATGKSFTGGGKAFRTGWDEYLARSRKAHLN